MKETSHDLLEDILDPLTIVLEYNKDSHYLPSDLIRIFGVDKNTILRKETSGGIPHSIWVKKGNLKSRAWTIEQLPLIGEALGFLPKLKGNHVISVFTLKGGTLKTSLTYQFARFMALHGNKVLVIGLDAQQSITEIIRGQRKIQDEWFEDITKGIYHVIAENESIENVIENTDLPTLKLIPETLELTILDRWLKLQRNQEHIIENKIIKKIKKDFNLIIFDCNPSWDTTVDNALGAANILLSPMNCSINTYRAMRVFTQLIDSYIKEDITHKFDIFRVIPTLLRPTKASKFVESKYRVDYKDICLSSSIKDATIAETSNALGKSLVEISSHKQDLTRDYIHCIKEIASLLIGLEGEGNAQLQ